MTPDLESDPAARAADRLQHYVRCYDNALPAELCAGLIAGFEQTRALQEANGRGLRAGLDHSAWTELNLTRLADPAMQGFFFAQVDTYLERYNTEVPLTLPIPPSRRTADLVIKRYRKETEERFQPHFDSINEAANRYLVFLWYLNDVVEGGETEFCDLGVRVQARAGRLLMFPPYWMYQHAGLPPRSNDKYILSTYLLFQPSAIPSAR